MLSVSISGILKVAARNFMKSRSSDGLAAKSLLAASKRPNMATDNAQSEEEVEEAEKVDTANEPNLQEIQTLLISIPSKNHRKYPQGETLERSW